MDATQDDGDAADRLTDRHGRIWIRKGDDLYVHDGVIAHPRSWVASTWIQLPGPGLAEQLPEFFAVLCDICRQPDTTALAQSA